MLLSVGTPLSQAKAETFDAWVQQFKPQARAVGISDATLTVAFQGVTANPRVIELDRKQPERSKMGYTKYLTNVMSQRRIDDGRANFAENRSVLLQMQSTYGVPAEVVVALWGLETSYGANTGGFDLIEALATLAWEGRRHEFFKAELIDALRILDGGHIRRSEFKGSWAGAMGQNQFMPSSWRKFAVDGNGDGHKDIWKTKADIFASSSNYLAQSGWDMSLPWGWPVVITDKNLKNGYRANMAGWLNAGIHFKESVPNIPPNTQLDLVIPDGGDGRAYLVTKNYEVIKKWNRSTYFALTVGTLSDLIARGPNNTAIPYNP